jgi:hypothetical protein
MIPAGVEVFVELSPIDLRWGFDRLAGMALAQNGRSARIGALFVFFGKRRRACIGSTPKNTCAASSGVVPLWPTDRMLELTPLFWARTRAKLDPQRLEAEFGPIAIPAEPLDATAPAEQQASTDCACRRHERSVQPALHRRYTPL